MFMVSTLPSKQSALLLPNYSFTFLLFQNKDRKDECVCNLSNIDSEIQTADFQAHANCLHSTPDPAVK